MGSQCGDTELTTQLGDWFRQNGRDLPWRKSRDPWLILVSELMLQQTQVSRVLERLPEFVSLFPSPRAMAAQPAARIIAAWSGLGYNRRAINLHRAAAIIADHHDGQVPSGRAQLMALPGVGAYTSRAVRVFAFELPDAVVDTNIGRVLARWEGRSLKPSEVQAIADGLVETADPWTWNQSIMELGALVCRKQPSCSRCPVSTHCRWFLAGSPAPDPATGSAGVSTPQSRFEGSDRQGRARLVRRLGSGPLTTERALDELGWPDDQERSLRVLNSLLRDGLVITTATGYELPT